MTSRTLRKDVSEIPVLVEPAAVPVAETFVPRPTEPPSAESQSAESQSAEPPSVEAKSPEPQPAEAAPDAGGQPLSERERAVLSFEKQHWKYSGAKEQAIRDRFEISANRYYQLLNGLLDRPEAQALEPALIKRLRRLRATKQQARSGRSHPRPA